MKIVLIGAGNVGYHLGNQLYQAGEQIIQVFSRQISKADRLAKAIGTAAISDLSQVSFAADLIILAVHDDAIKVVAGQLAEMGLHDKLIVHTSGATPSTIFENIGINRYGVFYPLQTFSVDKQPDFSNIPFCVHANRDEDLSLLEQLAGTLSPHVYKMDDQKRAVLHVAAVFVNNFSNHLFHIATDILRKKDLELKLLMPLIEETIDKIKNNDPASMQTGPAKRGDDVTIKNHLNYLSIHHPEYQKIYELLTASIQATK